MKWLTRKGSNKKTHRLDKPGLVLSLEALSPLTQCVQAMVLTVNSGYTSDCNFI